MKFGVNKSYYIPQRLADGLEVAKKRIRKNFDYFCIISGSVGSGKSTLARTIAKYCCPWFSSRYIAFTAEEFIKITNSCKKNSSVILDESFLSLNSKSCMTPQFKRIISHLQLLRQKNLFIVICLPNFFDLTKSIAVWRSNHLFLTYASSTGTRGTFLAFDNQRKRRLYIDGSRYMDYGAAKANWVASFTKNEGIIQIKDYDERKLAHLKAQEETAGKIETVSLQHQKWKTQREDLALSLDDRGTSHKEIAKIMDVSIKTVGNSLEEARKRRVISEKARNQAM